MENRIAILENNLTDEIIRLKEDHLTTIISIVGEYLWDSIQKDSDTSEEISQNTLDIIGFYCDKVDDDGAGYDMYLFPDDDEKLSSLLTELKAYDEEFKKLSTDEQENAEGSNYDLMTISSDYETILSYIEQANHPSELVIFHKR